MYRTLKSVSVYTLVVHQHNSCWEVPAVVLHSLSCHDRLEESSSPLMVSWAKISKETDVDCNNILKEENRAGDLFPQMVT